GQHGDRLGGGASGGDGADHRRAQPRTAQGFSGRGEGRDDARPQGGDRRALAHPAAGDRPLGGTEDGAAIVRPQVFSTGPPASTQALKPPRLRTLPYPMSFNVLPTSAERPPEAQ